MKLRIRSLEKIVLLIDTISSRLEYSMMPTAELLGALAGNDELRDFDFLKNCHEKCGRGEVFPKAWRASVIEKASCYALNGSDTEVLVSLGEIIGSVDAEGQINRLKACRDTVRSALLKAEQAFEKYGKNLPAIGALCSITVGIVLI